MSDSMFSEQAVRELEARMYSGGAERSDAGVCEGFSPTDGIFRGDFQGNLRDNSLTSVFPSFEPIYVRELAKSMHRFAKAGVVITMGAALAVGIPGIRERIRERGALLVSKLLGSSKEPWDEVAVQMAPYRWRKRVRIMLGHWDEWTRHLNYPLQLDSQKVRMYQIYRGATPNLGSLDCHYTVLAEGQTPHPPHVHDDEEIIVPLVSSVDILRAAAADLTATSEERISFGRFVYHASRLPHTIRAVGPGPSAYLVLRWSASAVEGTPDGAIPAQTFDFGRALASEPLATQGKIRTLIFEGPTRLLRRLHAHVSFARPGEGSNPHQDAHDVVVIVLDGTVETTSERVEAPGIIFHPAGRTHFLRSVGVQPARYVAIEFLQRN